MSERPREGFKSAQEEMAWIESPKGGDRNISPYERNQIIAKYEKAASSNSHTPTGTKKESDPIAKGVSVGEDAVKKIISGPEIKEIIKRRREAAEKGISAAQYAPIKEKFLQRAKSLRGMQAGAGIKGATAGAQRAQIGRQYASDVAAADIAAKSMAGGKLESMLGGVAQMKSQLPLSYAALEVAKETGAGIQQQASQPVQYPSSGGLFKVICTELWRQGKLSDEIYEADMDYGYFIRKTKPEVYIGYRKWATPVANLMAKSKIVTAIVAPLAKAWAQNMAYRIGYSKKNNLFGAVLSLIGEPLCGMIGKFVRRRDGIKIEA